MRIRVLTLVAVVIFGLPLAGLPYPERANAFPTLTVTINGGGSPATVPVGSTVTVVVQSTAPLNWVDVGVYPFDECFGSVRTVASDYTLPGTSTSWTGTFTYEASHAALDVTAGTTDGAGISDCFDLVAGPAVSPSPSADISPSPSADLSASPSPELSASPSPAFSVSPSPEPSVDASPSVAESASAIPSVTPSASRANPAVRPARSPRPGADPAASVTPSSGTSSRPARSPRPASA